MKYFLVKSTGLILGVPENGKTGQGENATSIVEQYEARPDLYTPVDKNGQPKAEKTEKVKKKAEQAEKTERVEE